MPKILTKLGTESYPIYVGMESLLDLHSFLKNYSYSKFILFCDKNARQHVKRVQKILKVNSKPCITVQLECGEKLKSFSNINKLYTYLIQNKVDRNSLIISFGGGTLGDATGFVASTYLRGIDWIQIPTTLLAQVDASVGGKTGINHPLGKNLIGTFKQPKAVFIEPQFLKTLSKRELISGLGELLKYGFIVDRNFYYNVINQIDRLMSLEMQTLTDFISEAIHHKAKIVSDDIYDKTGRRQILNFGHTLGHSLETYYNFKKIKHGEGVLIGMRYSLILSHLKGMLKVSDYEVGLDGLRQITVPRYQNINPLKLWESMKLDKKTENARVKMVLLKEIGRAIPKQTIEKKEFKEAWKIMVAARFF